MASKGECQSGDAREVSLCFLCGRQNVDHVSGCSTEFEMENDTVSGQSKVFTMELNVGCVLCESLEVVEMRDDRRMDMIRLCWRLSKVFATTAMVFEQFGYVRDKNGTVDDSGVNEIQRKVDCFLEESLSETGCEDEERSVDKYEGECMELRRVLVPSFWKERVKGILGVEFLLFGIG